METKSNSSKSVLRPTIAYALVFIMNMAYMLIKGVDVINSDASSEMVLARLLNDEGGIISRNWYYSTELRVLNTQLVYKLALAVFGDNWHMARCLSVAIFMLIILLASIYLGYQLRGLEFGIWLGTLLIMPVGKWYGYSVIWNSFYVPHIVISLLSVGLILHIHRRRLSDGRCNAIGTIALVIMLSALSLVAGMGGVRQLMICYVPLVGASVLLVLWRYLRRGDSIRRAIAADDTFLFETVITLIFSGIGYVINSYLHNYYTFSSYSSSTWSGFSVTGILDTIGDFLGLFGWSTYTSVVGFAGITNFLSLFIMAGVVAAIVWVYSHINELELCEKFVYIYSGVTFIILLIVYSHIEAYNESYWIPVMPFVVVIGLIALYRARFNHRREVIVALAVCVLLCSITSMRNINAMNNSKNKQPLADCLISEGYTQVIAPFWEANVITELTDGTIEVWCVESDLEISEWLQTKDHSDNLPTGRCAVIMETDDLSASYDEVALADYLIYEDSDFLIYGFEDISVYESIINE